MKKDSKFIICCAVLCLTSGVVGYGFHDAFDAKDKALQAEQPPKVVTLVEPDTDLLKIAYAQGMNDGMVLKNELANRDIPTVEEAVDVRKILMDTCVSNLVCEFHLK